MALCGGYDGELYDHVRCDVSCLPAYQVAAARAPLTALQQSQSLSQVCQWHIYSAMDHHKGALAVRWRRARGGGGGGALLTLAVTPPPEYTHMASTTQ